MNYAFRKLRGNSPAMAFIVAPYTAQLQKVLVQEAPNILPKPAAHWPDWRKKSDVREDGVRAARPFPAEDPTSHAEEGGSLAVRVLRKQGTDDTTLPMQSDAQSCSDTETWTSSPSSRRHSRKPRRGRRAKARLHAQHFEDCSRTSYMQQAGEAAGGFPSGWNVTLGALIESLDASSGDEGIGRDFLGCFSVEQDGHDSADDSAADPGNASSEEIVPNNGSTFVMEVRKRMQEPLGMALEEHADAIVVSKVFSSGAVASTRSQDNILPSIMEGDVVLSVNGATDMESIMSVIFSSTDLRIEYRSGPYTPMQTCVPSVGSAPETGCPEDDCNIVAEGVKGQRDLQQSQHLEHLREMDRADRRIVAAGIGRNDLSQLIAERLARSKRDQT